MKFLQSKEGIITLGKNIVYHSLENEINYNLLNNLLEKDKREINWPNTYYRDQIKSVFNTIGLIINGEYTKSGFSKTSAYTSGSHTHLWKNPDDIHKEGNNTNINTKRLLELGSQWYINDQYSIDDLLQAKKELQYLLNLNKKE